MLKKRIIPCLDVKDGRVVKGINFLDLVDAGDPVQQAKFYSENGADEICFLDISASLENRDTILKMVEKTAEEVFIPLTVGGGVRSIENIQNLLKAGADKVSIYSAAIKARDIIKKSSKFFGSQGIVVAVDVKKDNGLVTKPPGLAANMWGGWSGLADAKKREEVWVVTANGKDYYQWREFTETEREGHRGGVSTEGTRKLDVETTSESTELWRNGSGTCN
mgnify:CR=1 FL=1